MSRAAVIKGSGRYLRDQSVARPLREEAEESGDEESTPHTGRPEYVQPCLLGLLEFDLDCAFDLYHFGFHNDRVAISFCVVRREDVEGFIVAVLTDQVPGAFGEEPSSMRECETPDRR